MRLACVFLLLQLLATGAFAQSRLAIDKLDRKNLIIASKEVPYGPLEGTSSPCRERVDPQPPLNKYMYVRNDPVNRVDPMDGIL